MPLHPDLSPEEIASNKKAILRKLKGVAKALEDVLAGQDSDLLSIPLLGQPDPAWNKIQRLRYYMKMLDSKVKGILAGNYGFCEGCANPIPPRELGELPWADTCSACAAKGSSR